MKLQIAAQKVLDEIKAHNWYLTKSTVKALEEALAGKEPDDFKEKLLAMALIWEDTGKYSISRRIRETMNFCANQLREIIS